MQLPAIPDYTTLYATQWRPENTGRDAMREACEEAEGLFAGIMLKEGLASLFSEADENGSHMRGLLELTVEELAREMGRAGTFGIADQLYEQLNEFTPLGAAVAAAAREEEA